MGTVLPYRLSKTLLFIFCLMVAVPVSYSAYAACSGPVGSEGEVVYNSAYNVLQYCDNTDWISMAAGTSGTGSSACSNVGEVLFNSAHGVPQFCNGTNWISMTAEEGSGGGVPCDTTYQKLSTYAYSYCSASTLASTAMGDVDSCQDQCLNTWYGTYGDQCCEYAGGTCKYTNGVPTFVMNANSYGVDAGTLLSTIHVVSTEGSDIYCIYVKNGADYYSICGGYGAANEVCSTIASPGDTVCSYGATSGGDVTIRVNGGSTTGGYNSSGNYNGVDYIMYQGDGSGNGGCSGGGGGPTWTGSSPCTETGRIIYNDDHNIMQFCDGSDWKAIGKFGP